MNESRTLEILLILIIVGIFSFVGTYWIYIELKQSYCNQNLESADCLRNYPGFLHKTFTTKPW